MVVSTVVAMPLTVTVSVTAPTLRRDVEPDILVDPHDDVGVLRRLKAGQLRDDGVAADRQAAQHVQPDVVADGGVSALVATWVAFTRDARHHPAAGVTHDARDAAGRRLGAGRRRKRRDQQRCEYAAKAKDLSASYDLLQQELMS